MKRQVIIIIILVLVMICKPVIFSKNCEQTDKIIVPWHKELGYIAAAPAEIEVNIISKFFKVRICFLSIQNGYRCSVAPDYMWVFAEIIGKISRRIIAACGNICITAFEHIGKYDQLIDGWFP